MKQILGIILFFFHGLLGFSGTLEKQDSATLDFIATREQNAVIAGLKEVLGRRAQFLEEEKNLSENEYTRRAIDIAERFEALVRRFPDSVPAAYFYADFLRDGGENERAEKLLVSAEKKEAEFAPVQFLLAELFAARNAVEEAFPRFVSAVYLDPGNTYYHGVFGEFLCTAKDHLLEKKVFTSREELDEKMQSEFLEACATAPDDLDSFWRYAESFYDVENADWLKALNAWDRVARKIETEKRGRLLPAVSLHRARVLAELGQLEEASALLREISGFEDSRQKVFEIIKKKRSSQ